MNLMNIEQNAENLRLLGLIVAQRGETLYQHNWDLSLIHISEPTRPY